MMHVLGFNVAIEAAYYQKPTTKVLVTSAPKRQICSEKISALI